MKKKLIIDLIMFILMIILMFYNLTGGLYHEILGIILFIIYIIHIALNYKAIKKMGVNIMKGESLPFKITLGFILDILLFICLIILMITGIIISKYIFNINGIGFWIQLHDLAAYIMFGTIIVHVLLHLKMISKYLSNKLHIEEFIVNIIFLSLLGGSTFIVYRHFINEKKSIDNSMQLNNNSSSNSGSNSTSGGGIPTLAQYLGSKHCSGCHNHCVLTAIRCSIGKSAIESATSEYNSKYETTTSTTSNTSNLSNEYSDENVTYTVNL